MEMIKIKFIETCAPKNGSGESFTEGQEIEMPYASAQHWIKRRKALAVGGEITPPPSIPAPNTKVSDAAAEREEKRRGRKPSVVSGHDSVNENFASGDDV